MTTNTCDIFRDHTVVLKDDIPETKIDKNLVIYFAQYVIFRSIIYHNGKITNTMTNTTIIQSKNLQMKPK